MCVYYDNTVFHLYNFYRRLSSWILRSPILMSVSCSHQRDYAINWQPSALALTVWSLNGCAVRLSFLQGRVHTLSKCHFRGATTGVLIMCARVQLSKLCNVVTHTLSEISIDILIEIYICLNRRNGVYCPTHTLIEWHILNNIEHTVSTVSAPNYR
jgi:hypothetical protein